MNFSKLSVYLLMELADHGTFILDTFPQLLHCTLGTMPWIMQIWSHMSVCLQLFSTMS